MILNTKTGKMALKNCQFNDILMRHPEMLDLSSFIRRSVLGKTPLAMFIC